MGLTFVFSLSGALECAPGLRIRPVFEWDGCIVFDPGRRQLVELNLASWLVLELCDGRGFPDLRSEFLSVVGARVETVLAERYLQSALYQLAESGLVKRRTEAAVQHQGRAEG
jgi:hypothetical protein